MPYRRSKLNPNVRVRDLPTHRYRVKTEGNESFSIETYHVDGILRIVVNSLGDITVFDKDGNEIAYAGTTSYCEFRLLDIGVTVVVIP
jgi:hypothetical protein